jgi:arylsulfatase
MLFTDQQRYDTIGALGNPIIRTPVLDGLCKEGTVFTRCYTPSPVCIPARAAMVTGQPPHRTGCVDNSSTIDPETPSFMQRLRDRGYQTHGAGKMHFVPHRTRPWGFESRDISERGDDDYRAFLDSHGFEYVLDVHGSLREMYAMPQVSQMPAHLHESSWVADRSIAFLQDRDRSRPFFLWSSFFSPHPPFTAPTPWNLIYWAAQMPAPHRPPAAEQLLNFWNHAQNRAKYRGDGYDVMLMRTIKAFYYASISFVDYQIGRILESLGEELDNTLVIFASDHGELLGDYGCMGKRCMFDAAARVPLIVRWPHGVHAGSQYDDPANLLDIYPTLLTAAGDPDPFVCEEGKDLASLLRGGTRDRVVFSQLQAEALGLYMAATRSRKYVYSAADEKEWLFDLTEDPLETRDQSQVQEYGDDLLALRNRLIDRFRRDGYESPLKDRGWRLHGKRRLPADTNVGLAVQHPPNLLEKMEALGPYAPDELPPTSWMGKTDYPTISNESDKKS